MDGFPALDLRFFLLLREIVDSILLDGGDVLEESEEEDIEEGTAAVPAQSNVAQLLMKMKVEKLQISIMVAITYDSEVTSSISASKLFHALVLDGDNLVPKLLPAAIKRTNRLKTMKHRVDGIDKESFTYSYTLIEGDALMDMIESITYHIKIVPSADGGSVYKNRSIYHTKGDAQIAEEEIKAGKDKAKGIFKLLREIVDSILLDGGDVLEESEEEDIEEGTAAVPAQSNVAQLLMKMKIEKLQISIMVAITYDSEVTSSISASKLFHALVLDGDNLVPKLLPAAIKRTNRLKTMKHRVDGIDKESFTYSYTLIEGDALMDMIESITYHIKIVSSADGGSVYKNRSIYHTKGDAQIAEEEIKAGKDKAKGIFKVVEAYLHANPDAYN
ncbi:hypothetical protein RJ640_012019 [Escallonia rubra]|uniref:Bet v I/Major latex protein domain-containing protein n=1 Tax=Escallonia rubra TaxID=112253 RepID=A0AA88RD88_9ASTE|nr:hypothetical protein RJ640_012019 [Escallonia rubra]